jgi:hypothetical protein
MRPCGVDTTQEAKKNKPDSKKTVHSGNVHPSRHNNNKKRRAFGGTQAKKHALTGKQAPMWGTHRPPLSEKMSQQGPNHPSRNKKCPDGNANLSGKKTRPAREHEP